MAEQFPTVSLTIDGQSVTVPKGTTVYHAARQAGVEIPVFCYHDRMPPLGACRMCLVKVEKVPKLATSCTLEAADGMVVSTTLPEVKAGQEAILEFLLINHPLDCPICDKGGECPLQDHTFRFGPGRSRYVEAKRDFAKPVSLGRVLTLDRERCILCWRCVRFGEIVAGDDALKGFERGFHTEINTPFTLPVESKFIGNTIAICPVGALTARPYRFQARPWDNRRVPSVCTLCGVGCAVFFDARGDVITRTQAREEPEINDIWLCDLGFFGHGYVGHPDRLRQPLIRRDGGLQPATWDEALELVARQLGAASPARVAMLGGGRLTNEDAYVASRFFRAVIGTNHLDHRVDTAPGSPSLDVAWGSQLPIADLATRDAVLLVGCDITEEYPVLWLRLYQAIARGARVVVVTPKRLEIDRHVTYHLVHRYGQGGDVLAAITRALDGADRRPEDVGGVPAALIAAAAGALAGTTRAAVLIGRTALEGPDGNALLEQATALSARLGVPLSVLRGRGNAFGAALAGLLPHAGPGGRPLEEMRGDLQVLWGRVPSGDGFTAPEIIDAAGRGDLDVVYVIAADPAADVPDRSRWEAARAGMPFLVVQDAFLTETAQLADVVLPALVAAEKDGTVSNIEGRVQRIQAAVHAPGEARGDWQILSVLARRLGGIIAYSGWEEIFDEMSTLLPDLRLGARILPAPPAAGAPSSRVPASRPMPGTAEDPGLVLIAGEALFHRGAIGSRAAAIADLAGEPWALLHPDDAASAGIDDGDPAILSSSRASLLVRAKISTAILPGQILLPRGYDTAPVNALVDLRTPLTRVRVQALAASTGVGDG